MVQEGEMARKNAIVDEYKIMIEQLTDITDNKGDYKYVGDLKLRPLIKILNILIEKNESDSQTNLIMNNCKKVIDLATNYKKNLIKPGSDYQKIVKETINIFKKKYGYVESFDFLIYGCMIGLGISLFTIDNPEKAIMIGVFGGLTIGGLIEFLMRKINKVL